MAYIYEKDEVKREMLKRKLNPHLATHLPKFNKIPDYSTKFQLRIRKPGVAGPAASANEYTLSPPRVEESFWAYDESEVRSYHTYTMFSPPPTSLIHFYVFHRRLR
jgi:hypothetical protein